MTDDISHEGLRVPLRWEGVTFQPAGDRATLVGPQGGAKVQALPTDARNGVPNG